MKIKINEMIIPSLKTAKLKALNNLADFILLSIGMEIEYIFKICRLSVPFIINGTIYANNIDHFSFKKVQLMFREPY